MMLSAQQFLVVVVVRTSFPQWDDVIDVDADAYLVFSPAGLAQAVISGADALSVLHASRASLALHRAGPHLEYRNTVACYLQAGLEGL